MGQNSEPPTSFNTWLVQQPELRGSGYVYAVNDHPDIRMTLWWAGRTTDFQQRALVEAHARGIKVGIHVAKYSREALDQGSHAVFEAEAQLFGVGFALASVSSMDGKHDGLRVEGFDPAKPDEPLPHVLRVAVKATLRGIKALTDAIDVEDVQIEHGARPHRL